MTYHFKKKGGEKMKNALIGLSLLNHMLPNHNLMWSEKINRDGSGYREAKGYLSRKNFKRNQRKGL